VRIVAHPTLAVRKRNVCGFHPLLGAIVTTETELGHRLVEQLCVRGGVRIMALDARIIERQSAMHQVRGESHDLCVAGSTHINHLPLDLRPRLEAVELVTVHTPLLGERLVIEQIVKATNEVFVAIATVLVLGPHR
jgi:hypothetical protein